MSRERRLYLESDALGTNHFSGGGKQLKFSCHLERFLAAVHFEATHDALEFLFYRGLGKAKASRYGGIGFAFSDHGEDLNLALCQREPFMLGGKLIAEDVALLVRHPEPECSG